MSPKLNAFLLTFILAFCLMIRDSQQTPLTRYGRGSLPRYGKRFIPLEQTEEKYVYYSPGGNYLCEINTETEVVRCGTLAEFYARQAEN